MLSLPPFHVLTCEIPDPGSPQWRGGGDRHAVQAFFEIKYNDQENDFLSLSPRTFMVFPFANPEGAGSRVNASYVYTF